MKRFLVGAILVVFLICLVVCFGAKDNDDFFRINIVSNSFLKKDSDINVEIKDRIAEVLYPYIKECESVKEVYSITGKKISTIVCIIDGVLIQNNLDYKCSVKINNQYFRETVYKGNVIEGGFYDALTISLGDAKGESFLCLYSIGGFDEVDYESRFINLINS